jgi:hypothetical protein
MRWGQAKLILIAVFALMDAFLGWRLLAGQGAAVAPAASGPPVTLGSADTAGSSVRFEGVLPSWPQRLPTLTIRLAHPDAAAIASRLFGPDVRTQSQGSIITYLGPDGSLQTANGAILYQRSAAGGPSRPGPDPAQARAAADALLARMALVPSDLGYDRMALDPAAGAWRVDYVQRYQGQPIFNGRCEVQVDGRGVRAATCLWTNPVGPADSPRPILAPGEALQRLADVRGATAADPLTVTAVVLGYIAPTYQANAAWPTVPAWRITLTDGSLYYVNAYTGTLVPGPA